MNKRVIIGGAAGFIAVCLASAFITWGESPATWEPFNRIGFVMFSLWAVVLGAWAGLLCGRNQ